MLSSSKFDIQSVNFEYDTLYVTGEERNYHTPYMIGLEIDNSSYVKKVYVNEELFLDNDQHIHELDNYFD